MILCGKRQRGSDGRWKQRTNCKRKASAYDCGASCALKANSMALFLPLLHKRFELKLNQGCSMIYACDYTTASLKRGPHVQRLMLFSELYGSPHLHLRKAWKLRLKSMREFGSRNAFLNRVHWLSVGLLSAGNVSGFAFLQVIVRCCYKSY